MCTSPRKVQFDENGKLNWKKNYCNKEMVPFQLPCGKCAECLLERARDWSVRCVHESKMHEKNSFITLTYSDEKIPPNGELYHYDFQLFMVRLRKEFGDGIGFFMCGEYGETTGRPHYHACLFGVDFDDKVFVGENKHGDKKWNSKQLTELWGLGHTEGGSVTQKSAGYVARYVLKKQAPGTPKGYQKMSRTHAIGKRYIEKWWRDVFIYGKGSVVFSDGTQCKVPRYYEKWFKKNHFEEWLCYTFGYKKDMTERLKKKAEYEHSIYLSEMQKTKNQAHYKSPLARKRIALHNKQKQLKRTFL